MTPGREARLEDVARLIAYFLVLLCGCHHASGATPDGGATPGASASAVVTVEGPSATTDAGPPAKDAPRVWAVVQIAPIFSAMEFPPKDPDKAEPERKNVTRLGYFRSGESVPIKGAPTKAKNCEEGWFELLEGGFVCGRFVTQDPNNATMLHPPLDDGPLPYRYGMNLTNGAPIYREIPTIAQRNANEKNLLVGRSRLGDLAQAQQAAMQDNDGTVPWYLQDHKGSRPMVSFDDMRGDHGPNLLMRMVKGFYVGLDSEAKTPHHYRDGPNGGGKLWRTTSNAYVPQEYLLVHHPVTEFEGVDFRDPAETRKLPLGWITNIKGAWKYTVDVDKQKVHRTDHMDRFTILKLTGKSVEIRYKHYYETSEGFWMRDIDGTLTKPGPAPSDLGQDEKWIDVNLSTQSLVAYEGSKPVYATLISSGRHSDNPDKDHPTTKGNFRIREKHIAATMDDDSASDGPYSIQDVPWIMYFHGGLALHGAFWHSMFGHEHSHGCVNLTPFDAKKLFMWTGPRLPEGWHGIHATDANPGTRVIVHD